MNKSEKIKRHFEKEAHKYDKLIPNLIPEYYQQLDLILKVIPYKKEREIKVLDLGCGTGILSSLILNNYPNAKVVSFDLAENMINECNEKLGQFKDRVNFKIGNFDKDDFGKGYDLVLSGLAIHHLKDKNKWKLFKRVYNILNPQGMFVIRDIVLGSTPYLIELYNNLWREYIKSSGENDEKWFQKYLTEDSPTTIEKQIEKLKKIGFKDVDCYWKHINFVIFGGQK